MSKTEQLTEADVNSYPLNPEIIRYLKRYEQEHNLPQNNISVLDWGCGRGETVASLIKQGYTCRGVEINQDYLQNAKGYFENTGIDFNSTFSLIDDHGRTGFTEGSFDAVISDQVFEHVADPQITISEIYRITKPGGMSFHRYPPWGTLREPHLFMPMVHWLPKNGIRRAAIHFWMILGIDPWKNKGKEFKDRLDEYYAYSVNFTHFRTPGEMKRLFEHEGFTVTFVTIDNPRLNAVPVAGFLAKIPFLRGIISRALNFFIQTNILARKGND